MKKKNPTINRWANPPIKGETNSGEIITKPNQSMSIRDMLFRNTQGMTYDNFKTPYYEDQATFSSQSLNKIQEMEPTEKLQYLATIKTQVNDLENKVKDHEAQKAQAIADQQQSIIDQQTSTED